MSWGVIKKKAKLFWSRNNSSKRIAFIFKNKQFVRFIKNLNKYLYIAF